VPSNKAAGETKETESKESDAITLLVLPIVVPNRAVAFARVRAAELGTSRKKQVTEVPPVIRPVDG